MAETYLPMPMDWQLQTACYRSVTQLVRSECQAIMNSSQEIFELFHTSLQPVSIILLQLFAKGFNWFVIVLAALIYQLHLFLRPVQRGNLSSDWLQ